MSEGIYMFEFLKEAKKSIEKYEQLAEKNKYMTKPFNKVSNKTIVWTDKNFVFKK